jgi:hypothetical protein
MQAISIRVKGQINEQWSDWFGGLTISHAEPNDTILTGLVPDQAALFGIIARLRDLGLTICTLTNEERLENNLARKD